MKKNISDPCLSFYVRSMIILENMLLDKSTDIARSLSIGRESIAEWDESLNHLDLLIQSVEEENKDERFLQINDFFIPESIDIARSLSILDMDKLFWKQHLDELMILPVAPDKRINKSHLTPFSEFINSYLVEEPVSQGFRSMIGMGGLGKTMLSSFIYKPDVLFRYQQLEDWLESLELLFITASLVPPKSLREIKPLSRCYSAGYITSKDFATRCMIRKRKDLIKEWLSAVYRNQAGQTKLCSGESRLSFRMCLKELEELINNLKQRKIVDNFGNYNLLPSLPTEAKTVSQPPQVPSTPSERNRKKRLKKKLKNKAKREEMDNNLLRSYTCLLYIFASMHSGGYLLYRIDALEHARKSDENNELLPLLVFGTGVLPVGFCALVQMKDYLYFVGENPCDVFKIRKIDLKNLSPGEDNLGLEYLIPIKQQMQGPKRSPLVFVVNENLFVISRDYSCKSHEFEMYSPTNSSWKDLNPKPKGHGSLKSHVVLDNIAYFATTDETVLSYNLSDGIWSIVSTSTKYPRTFCDIHPAFDAPVEIVGDMILGAFKLPSDFNITVAASPYLRCDDSVKDSFMRPTLAPDSKFWPEFARRFDYIRNNESHGSHYMTALQTLDGQNILCFVSYGSNPSTDEPHRSYALLTYYKILGDHWKTSVRLKEEVLEGADKFCYYSRQVEAGNAVKSYFSLEFLNRKLFNISTTKLCTIGKLITCVAY